MSGVLPANPAVSTSVIYVDNLGRAPGCESAELARPRRREAAPGSRLSCLAGLEVLPGMASVDPTGAGHNGGVTVSQSGVLPCSGAAVRDWLQQHSPTEAVVFEQEFNDALKVAASSFDLSTANQVVRRWWLLAASRSQPATPAELEVVDRARRGDLSGLSLLEPDGTFSRVA